MLHGAAAQIRTPSGGAHLYFAGTSQRNGHLAASHIDFRAQGGYALIPPSVVDGPAYQHVKALGGRGTLDWQAAAWLLEPSREHHPLALLVGTGGAGRRAGPLARHPARRATATPACSGPRTAPWKPIPPRTSASWPPPPASSAWTNRRSPALSTPPAAPRRPAPEPPDRQAEGTR